MQPGDAAHLYQAKWGMREHVQLLQAQGLPVPQENPAPRVIIENSRRLETVS